MRKVTYTEGYLTCMPTIARRILAACIQNENEYTLRELQALAGAETAERDFLSAEFKQADGRVSCTLNAKLESDYRHHHMLDSDGNEWIEFRASFDAYWPSHGTSTLAQAAARVALYDEVVRLATRLQAEFGDRPLMHLYRTAEQIAEDKAKADAARAQRAVDAIVDEMVKGLRVGAISGARKIENVPDGDYQAVRGTKRYHVKVRTESESGVSYAMASRLEDAATTDAK